MNFYTVMANNSAASMMANSNARLGLMNSAVAGSPNMGAIVAADTQYAMQMAQDGFNYKMAQAELESLKKLQEQDKHGFDTFA